MFSLVFVTILLTLVLGTHSKTGLIRVENVIPAVAQDVTAQIFCMEYNSISHELPDNYKEQHPSSLINFSSVFGCSGGFHSDISGKVVAVARGNCTFFEKAANIQEHGGVAALIVDYSNETFHTTPEGIGSSINITVAIISHEDFDTMMAIGDNLTVWLYAPKPPVFDPNAVIMFLLAATCVMLGSYWSASVHHARSTCRLEKREEEENKMGLETLSMGTGVIMSVALVIFFCLIITLLYFFYDYLVYIIMAIFSFAGVNAIFQTFLPLWKKLIPWDYRIPRISCLCLTCLKKMPEVRGVALLAVSTSFVVTWLCLRHESYSWVLQDVIGICFCLYIMRALLMPSLRACTVLLGLLFVYDIFFVFITPLFTKNGESVMIKVATGGDSKTGEQMPIVFRLPYFLSWEMAPCFADRYSLLGFGDIILPGLLITYNCTFDMKTYSTATHRCRLLYFLASSAAYVVGLVLTGVALYGMQSGQPALLYLVPCTLFTTVVIALVRQELGHMWRGHQAEVGQRAGRSETGGRPYAALGPVLAQCPKKDDDAQASKIVHASSGSQDEEDVATPEEIRRQVILGRPRLRFPSGVQWCQQDGGHTLLPALGK
ncbi:signal peptide peptidase-like 2A isoform X2 [Pomacea canaliculata]|uniref:signal peptide peptidase-like 2A isoform X2 n=1 Tax=Pomacea canaliculata TaxID=400727 RepID=UPI000D726531|nr:signal peptide peptidase-like 2A isoform X2 [Pomacea canaliculata]